MSTVLQFVDSIGASPTLRLNLNDGTVWAGPQQGSDFSPPKISRAIADNLLVDGAIVASSAYDNREITLVLDLVAANSDAKNTQLRALNVELNRANNILKYQPGTSSNPVFFRTFRSPDYQLQEFPTDGYTQVTITLYAEPFAYGVQASQALVNVKYDATLTNGMYVDVNSVTGDVETPAYILFDSGYASTATHVIAVRRRGTPSSMPFAIQAEAMSLGTDATLFADGTGATGAGSNTVSVSFATTTSAALRVSTLTSTAADARGTYRLYARIRKTVAGDTITAYASYGGTAQLASAVTLAASSTAYQWYDLGLLQIPWGWDSYTGYSNTQPNPGANSLAILLARTAGTGAAVIDEIVLMPADAEFCPFKINLSSTVLDGPNDTQYTLSAGAIGTNPLWTRSGSIPMLSPSPQANRLFILPRVDGGGLPADTVNVTVSWWPRYLVV